MVELVAEQRKSRRPGIDLRHVSDLDATTRRCGRRIALQHGFEPAIELAGRDAAVPFLDRGEDRFHKAVEAFLLMRRDGNDGDASDLGQDIGQIVLHFLEVLLLVLDHVPFRQSYDDGAPLLSREIGESEVLALDVYRSVDQYHN